jgi:hypothetical protein
MHWNPWRAASQQHARWTIRGNQPSGLADSRRRFRPRVERLEERAAPGDSLRSLLFSLGDLAPPEDAPAPGAWEGALADRSLMSADTWEAPPAQMVVLGADPLGAVTHPHGAEAPPAAATPAQHDDLTSGLPSANPFGQPPTPRAPLLPALPTDALGNGGGASQSGPSGPPVFPPVTGTPIDPEPRLPISLPRIPEPPIGTFPPIVIGPPVGLPRLPGPPRVIFPPIVIDPPVAEPPGS